MAARKYRVAVVGGAGTWGRFYLRAYAEHPDCEVVALVDPARHRRRAFAERYRIDFVCDAVNELLAREVPDIVSAIVPVDQNCAIVTACAEAGVRVVSCEKPIAAELADADAMVSICRDRGTLLGCGQAIWTPATPYMPEVMDWVQQGSIGRLTKAAIPGGLPVEVSGAGCLQLAGRRLLTGMEVQWVEGWSLPADPAFMQLGRLETECDSPAYGRLGLSEASSVRYLDRPRPPVLSRYGERRVRPGCAVPSLCSSRATAPGQDGSFLTFSANLGARTSLFLRSSD